MIHGKMNMNSTNKTDDKLEQKISKFYKDKIISASKKIRERGVSFFPLRPEKGIKSYYEEHSDNNQYIFEYSINEISDILKEKWEDEKLAELVELVDPLFKLAAELKAEEIEVDISPFIYVMF